MIGDSNKVKFQNSFQIRTLVDGYNSGRTYYLKASSEDECAEVVKLLRSAAKTARKIKEAKTRFEKSQERVRVVYQSTIIQTIVAAMIVAVPSLPPTPLFPSRSLAIAIRLIHSIRLAQHCAHARLRARAHRLRPPPPAGRRTSSSTP